MLWHTLGSKDLRLDASFHAKRTMSMLFQRGSQFLWRA